MTAATRKASERARRKADGQVEYKGWLSASDHASLTKMARDSGMTQAQVVSRLIGMVGRIEQLERFDCETQGGDGWSDSYGFMDRDPDGDYIRHSDLTAAVGL